jgi:hypothetical protein
MRIRDDAGAMPLLDAVNWDRFGKPLEHETINKRCLHFGHRQCEARG